jgi:hypothetical protein
MLSYQDESIVTKPAIVVKLFTITKSVNVCVCKMFIIVDALIPRIHCNGAASWQ